MEDDVGGVGGAARDHLESGDGGPSGFWHRRARRDCGGGLAVLEGLQHLGPAAMTRYLLGWWRPARVNLRESVHMVVTIGAGGGIRAHNPLLGGPGFKDRCVCYSATPANGTIPLTQVPFRAQDYAGATPQDRLERGRERMFCALYVPCVGLVRRIAAATASCSRRDRADSFLFGLAGRPNTGAASSTGQARSDASHDVVFDCLLWCGLGYGGVVPCAHTRRTASSDNGDCALLDTKPADPASLAGQAGGLAVLGLVLLLAGLALASWYPFACGFLRRSSVGGHVLGESLIARVVSAHIAAFDHVSEDIFKPQCRDKSERDLSRSGIAGPFAHSCSEGGVTWNRLPLMRWHNNVRLAQYWNLRGLSEPEGPTKVCFYCPSGSVVLENYCEDRVWPEATVWRRDDLFKVNIGGLSQMKGLAFLIERSISDDASNHRNDGEEPVRPDRRIRTKPPGPLIFLFGAIAIGLGCLLAYRFEFIRQRPDVAFVLLVGYGGLVLLLCGLLGAWLSVALS